MTDQDLHEKIEAYLLGELSAQAKAAFEADIAADPQLAEEVELHRLTLLVPDRPARPLAAARAKTLALDHRHAPVARRGFLALETL